MWGRVTIENQPPMQRNAKEYQVTALPDPRTTPTMHVEQAAELLDVSRASAYKAVNAGEIPSIRIGKRILVPTAALLELLGLKAS